MNTSPNVIHSISVDVEEYFHASNLELVAPPAKWTRLPQRAPQATEEVLTIFADAGVKATFFVLGYVARRSPNLVKMIADSGHEIASHGYSHRLAFHQTPAQFRRDVLRAKMLLEDISGQRVCGYRAPSFSILDDNSWAYDILLETGHVYDSSVYPTWHPRYGNPHKPLDAYKLQTPKGGHLFEFPLAVRKFSVFTKDFRFPAAGGAYWRILPFSYCSLVLKSIESQGRNCHCYFHPWELDAQQPVFTTLSFLTKLRHYGGLKAFSRRLVKFLKTLQFAPIREVGMSLFGQEFHNALGREYTHSS